MFQFVVCMRILVYTVVSLQVITAVCYVSDVLGF